MRAATVSMPLNNMGEIRFKEGVDKTKPWKRQS